MSILDEIIIRKRAELQSRRESRPLLDLEKECRDVPACRVIRSEGIIAEMKRKSPSKGMLRDFNSAELAAEYEQGGAAALSILTDENYFGGTLNDLKEARNATALPLLRKDFTIDRYQIAEARVAGADIILLIAAVLSTEELSELHGYAKQLGLEVLVEVHNRAEIDKLPRFESGLIGVNNRDLKSFAVNMNNSTELASAIPSHLKKVAESGITALADIVSLREAGFSYFLIGEHFMRAQSAGLECRRLSDAMRVQNSG